MIVEGLQADVPITIGREAARDAARQELSQRIYEESEPSLPVRILEWVLERVQEIFDRVGTVMPGGWPSLIILLAIAVAAAYAISRGIGPVRGRLRLAEPVFGPGAPRTSAEHRARADNARAQGDLATAVRERFRAIVRLLEERGLLDERPGRTADEAAAEAGALLPTVDAGLRAGVRIFDEIAYGGHPAHRAHDDELQMLYAAIRSARPTTVTTR